MEGEVTTKIRELSPAFIAELNKQNFPASEFEYVDLGSVSELGDLRRVKIKATCYGLTLYHSFKESWIANE